MFKSDYKSRSRGKRKSKTIPIKATEEMLQLVQTTRIELNGERDTVYIWNGSEKPIQGPIAGDPLELAKQSTTVLKPKVVQLFRATDDVAARWIGLLNDEIFKIIGQSDSGEVGEDNSPIIIALDLVEEKTVDLFLDEVKTPYALVKVNGHLETIPIRHQKFEDWVGALYYCHQKEMGYKDVLSKQMITQIQSILSFEAGEKDTRTLYVRIAAFLDTEARSEENVVFYDLCNKNWEVVKITSSGWNVEPIEQNYNQVLFKRFNINNPQVYPVKDHDSDIMDQFIKLTNVHNDYNNTLLSKVYTVSLFLLANLPKPMLIPHGLHGSGKSTFQEFEKMIVDPSAALTTAFPKSLEELVQALSHSYLTFFDNVSTISDLTSDQLCRAVTGGGFVKRALYENDDDFIYNMKRAVGYNGINIAATRADLLDRILNIQLKRIDKRHRKKVEQLTKEMIKILPQVLGYIFDVIVKVLNRIGEVKLQELPRMADFAEMGELIARCLGYDKDRFTEAYNANIGLTNEEAISANPVATAIIHLMNDKTEWSGLSMKLLSDLNIMIKGNQDLSWISENKEWPRGPTALSHRLTEVIPNLADMDIIVDRDYDKHTKTYNITIKKQQQTSNSGLADVDGRSKSEPKGDLN